ncbi:MAG TPA: universal stress protein [Clostridia bacterium]|nr:universal stress protein [Clostridia bacterium]
MGKRIMVCVTQQKSCENLIKKGSELVEDPSDEIFVIHVIKDGWRYFSEMKESDALEYLYTVSKEADAELIVYKSDNIEKTLSEKAKENQIDTIVLGESLEKKKQQNMIERLKKQIDLPIHWEII